MTITIKNEIMTGIKIISETCVNSKWKADWLCKPHEEGCQCIVECKVKVSVEMNGHKPQLYIVNESEFNRLKKHLNP